VTEPIDQPPAWIDQPPAWIDQPPAWIDQPPAWIDQHCHLPADEAEVEAVVDAALAAHVVHMVDVGCDVAGSVAAIERARRFAAVSATAGVHPHEAAGGIDGLAELLLDPQVVAVGECGLDYHYDHSPRDVQRTVFAQQIELANETGLPLVIHTRSAWSDTFDVLDEVGVPERLVFHCFTGGVDEACACLDRGAVLSFSGIVTFNSAKDVQAAASMCPLDRLMVETDSPYLAPVPHRGRRNEPAWVGHVGAKIAELRDLDVVEVARSTSSTARGFFGID